MNVSEEDPRQTVFVTQLAQLHRPESLGDLTENLTELISQSQFKVAEYLLDHPNDVIVVESLTEDYNLSSKQKFSTIATVIRLNFPNGFPKNISELNKHQKKCLIKYGAPETLFHLGLLKALYKSCDALKRDCYESEIRKKMTEYPSVTYIHEVYAPRERQAIYWARKTALETNNPNIIIVFGVGHDFKKRIELIGDKAVCFKELIDTTPASYKDKNYEIMKNIISELHYRDPELISTNSCKSDFDQYYHSEEQQETIQQIIKASKEYEFEKFFSLLKYALKNSINLNNIPLTHGEVGNILHLYICHHARKLHFEKCLRITGNQFINIPSSEGSTPLHYAIKKNYIPLVKILIKAGADISIKDSEGKSALTIAKENNFTEIANLLTNTASVAQLANQGFYSLNGTHNKKVNIQYNSPAPA